MCIANDVLNDRQLAEEAVQDVFIKLWETGDSLSIDTSLSAYLIKMTRNRSIDYLRANERRIKTVSIEDLEIQLQLHKYGMEDSIDEELFTDALEEALNKAIKQLPAQCRQIFILNRLEGFSTKEIAEKLQISVSTVKTQISRALIRLKETISTLD